jgi:hypothetical protein
MDKIIPHPLPESFDPQYAAEAIRGIAQAIYQLIAGGMPTKGPAASEFHCNLEGLAYAACYFANQLDAYYREQDYAHLPYVREETPIYGGH